MRIDAQVQPLDEVQGLQRNHRHDIEAVVDRFRVREDVAIRLAESVETALKLADGKAMVAWLDEPARSPLVFSASR